MLGGPVATPASASPNRVGKPLEEPFDGYHSARRGTYRIIYRLCAAGGAQGRVFAGAGQVAAAARSER
jgi:hypothetical protein